MADQKINGALYRSMVIEGALAIAEKKEQANELNVFPVPDGDTGTNMSMTMGSAMAEMEKLAEPTLAKAADATASALLRGARGNSGVILSLLFRGMAKKLRETDEADGRTLALALREGVDTAYKAVMKPAEGTILTVSRVAAQHAVELCQAEPTLTAEQVLAAILEHGHTALEETVHQNPVLEKAGVVDAGGFGFITIFEGMLDALRGIHKERAVAAEPTKSTADFAAINDEDITFTYCTEFIISRENQNDPEKLRQFLSSIGDSLVLVDDDEIIKVHVHTNDPGRALHEAIAYGSFVTVKVENMRLQHTEKVMSEKELAPKIAEPTKPIGVVSVCAGDGLADVFTNLGADAITGAAAIINNLQQYVSRMSNPLDPVVLTIGTISGGNRYNAIANHVTMEGVTRAYFLDKHEEAMRQIVENTAEGLGMKAVLKYAHVVHPVINDDDDLTEIAQKAVVKLFGEETLCHMPAMMGSEDFANYAAEIPAVFGFIGCRDEANGMIYNNHHEKFTVNESLLPKGTALMAQFAVDYLAGNA